MKKGIGIIEVVVGAAIILVVMLAVSDAVARFLRNSHSTLDSIKAEYYLEEGVEVAKFLRDYSYTGNIASMSESTKYYIEFDGVSWATSTTKNLLDGTFERYITAEPVSRDAQGHIVLSGGILDNETKKLDVSIAWNSGDGTSTRTIPVYVVNVFSN